MNTRTILITLGAVAVATPLLKLIYDRTRISGGRQSTNGSSPQVKHMVEKTLHDHKGEDKPFVHAFEEALDEEIRLEHDLAAAIGLRA